MRDFFRYLLDLQRVLRDRFRSRLPPFGLLRFRFRRWNNRGAGGVRLHRVIQSRCKKESLFGVRRVIVLVELNQAPDKIKNILHGIVHSICGGRRESGHLRYQVFGEADVFRADAVVLQDFLRRFDLFVDLVGVGEVGAEELDVYAVIFD